MPDKINYHNNIYTKFFTIAPGIWGLKDVFVNIYMILNPFDGNWVLIDAGLKWSAPKIKKMAIQLFGDNSKPSSIILTHGHFDHIGALQQLIREWNVPVFAHYLEIPYLTGKSSYPPPDPTVGGGLISLMAWTYPSSPINISNSIVILPENGRVPGLPEWKYIHTPGHAPGHISLFRESDSILLAGDAFVTTKAESALATMMQYVKLSGPPKYFTYDWIMAKKSFKKLMDMDPQIAATGHGRPMQGEILFNELQKLGEHFDELAVPSNGRYINASAVTNAAGVIYTPPNNINQEKLVLKVLTLIAISAGLFIIFSKKNKKRKKLKEAISYEVW